MLGQMLRAAAGASSTGVPIPSDYDVFYSMDNIVGSTLIDEAGNADGTISGATQTAGYIGDALLFNSSSDVVTSTFYATPVKTFSFWVKCTNPGSINIIYENNTNTNTIVDGFVIYIDGSGRPALNYRGSVISTCTANIPFSCSDGAYHHVVIEVLPTNLTSDQIKFWVDGAFYTTLYGGTAQNSWSFVSRTTYMGQRVGGVSPLSGELDQWREYGRSLTNLERNALFNEV